MQINGLKDQGGPDRHDVEASEELDHVPTGAVYQSASTSTAPNVDVVPLVDEISTTLTMANNGNQYRQNLTSQIFATG